MSQRADLPLRQCSPFHMTTNEQLFTVQNADEDWRDPLVQPLCAWELPEAARPDNHIMQEVFSHELD